MSIDTDFKPVAQVQSYNVYAELGEARQEIVSVPLVTITLPLEDAKVLVELTNHVGGYPNGSRGKIDALREALTEAGVDRPGWDDEDDELEVEGRIEFKDGSYVAPDYLKSYISAFSDWGYQYRKPVNPFL